MLPEQPSQNPSVKRSLGISLGVSEVFFLAGFVLLAIGIFSLYGMAAMSAACGAVLVITSWVNTLGSEG